MAGEKILVVDDEKDITVAFERLLRLEGYKVDMAANGEEAVVMAKRKEYALVFIDLIMPKMSGIETCKAIKKVSPNSIPILFTGKINSNTFEKEINFMKVGGEIYYLYKPFKEGEILEAVKQALQKRK